MKIKNIRIAIINIIINKMKLLFNKNDVNAYYQVGCSLEYLNKFKVAEKFLSIAIKKGQFNFDVFFRRGCCYDFCKNQNQNLALADYLIAIEIDPYNAKIYYNIGNIYSNFGDYEKAIENYLKNIELDGKDPKPYIGLGYLYYIQKLNEKAIHYYKDGIRLEPSYIMYIPDELKEYLSL